MTIDYAKLATEIGGNMNKGIENLKEIEALKQQLHTDREAHQKEIALVREDAQIDMLNQTKKYADNIFEKDNRIKELEIINKEHQKLNGELQVKLSEYEDQAAHYRRKAIL